MSMTNVLAFQNWEKATIRVVLLAHWDTRPTADMEPNEADRLKPIIGANDGASGVAVLLELMRAVKGKTGEIGICYAFVDGEDLGPGIEEMFLGATYFSTHLPNPKPHYGILLDMIGDADLRVPKEQYSDMYAPDLLRALYLHAASVDLRKEFPNVLGQAILDDHLALNKVGIPTVDLIDFDYEPWHTLRDTPDKCSPSSLFKVGKLLETWLTKPNPYRPRS
jgi:Zn-dependent M28 family amino/carboxypeptidase